MKFFKKKINILILSVLVFIVVAFVGVMIFTNPTLIKAKVISSLPEFIRPFVEIEEVELNLLRGLKMQGVMLEDENPANERPVFSSPLIFITPRQKPLVFGQWIPDKVQIDSPTFSFLSFKSGDQTKWNIVDLVRRIIAQSEGLGIDQLPTELKIENGRVFLSDEQLKTLSSLEVYELIDFNFHFQKKSSGSYFFNGSFIDPKLGRINYIGTFKGQANGDIEADLAFSGSGKMILDQKFRDRLSGQFAEVWDVFNPSGQTEFKLLRISFRNVKGKTDLKYALVVELDNLRCTYVDFSYPMTDITGTIEFTEKGVQIVEPVLVTLENDTRDVLQITGGMTLPLDEAEVDMKVTSQGFLTFDDKLRRAIKPLNKDIWQRMLSYTDTRRKNMVRFWDWFKPRGKAKLTYTVKGPVNHPDVFLELDFEDTDFLFNEFPYPLKDVDASVEIGPEEVRIRKVNQELEDGFIRVSGIIDNLKKIPQIKLDVSCKNLPLDKSLKDSLDERGRQSWQYLRPQGKVDIEALFKGSAFKPDVRIKATMKGVTFQPVDIVVPLENIKGEVIFYNEKDVVDVYGKVIDANMTVKGEIDHPVGGPDTTKLEMFIKDLDLQNKQMRRTLKIQNQDIWQVTKSYVGTENPSQLKSYDLFRPSGLADVKIDISGVGKEVVNTYELYLKNANATFLYFPYSLSEINGKVFFGPDKTEFTNITCRHNDTEILISGSITGSDYDTEISIDCKNMRMDEDILGILKKDDEDFFKEYDVFGSCDVHARLFGKGGLVKTDIVVKPRSDFVIHSKVFDMDLTDITGEIRFIADKAIVNIVGKTAEGAIITISDSEIEGKGKAARVSFSLLAENLKLDAKLYKGLDEQSRKTLESLSVDGLADVILDLNKEAGLDAKEDVKLQVKAKDLKV
ncbi:MAG: hypothetical protein J7M38_01390, partial [Armatimonadetes bacterium]|nr:hypothetical protein [Armatimonadota bacterium]